MNVFLQKPRTQAVEAFLHRGLSLTFSSRMERCIVALLVVLSQDGKLSALLFQETLTACQSLFLLSLWYAWTDLSQNLKGVLQKVKCTQKHFPPAASMTLLASSVVSVL